MKYTAIIILLILAAPQLVIASKCDYDRAYIAGLNTTAEKVPDIEQHAPYQVVEYDEHWLVVGYSGPGHSKVTRPDNKIKQI